MGDWDPVTPTTDWTPVETKPQGPWEPVAPAGPRPGTPGGRAWTPLEREVLGMQQPGIFGLEKLPPSEAGSYLGRTGDIWGDVKGKFSEGVESLKAAPGELVKPTQGEGLVSATVRNAASIMPFGGGVMHPGVGKLLGGFFDIVGSPVMGPYRSLVSRPLEEKTGVPHQITEFPAELVSPYPVQKAVSGIVKAAIPAVKFLEKVFSPGSVDAAGGTAESLLRSTGGTAARDTAITQAAIEPYWAKINAMDDAGKRGFMAYIEGRSKGAPLSGPSLQPIADILKTEFRKRMNALLQMPSTARMGFIEDYFPHMWQDPVAARKFFRGGGAKQGSGGFTKERSIPTIEDGINAGLVPKTLNPLEATMEYVANADRFIAANATMDEARRLGTVKFFKPGSKNIPSDWVPLDGRLGKRSTPVGEMRAFAPEGFARVYNRFVDRGIHGKSEMAGQVYDKVRMASNAITALELGVSGFHAVTMANEAGISSLARGIERIVGGARGGDLRQMMRGLGNVAESPVAFVTSALRGKKLEQIYLGRSPGSRDMREVVDLLEQSGGRGSGFRHAPDYEFSPMNSYWTSWKRGALRMEMEADKALVTGAQGAGAKTIAGLRVGFRNMGRILQTVAKPLFENYIPKLKNGAFYDTMKGWLEMNPAATQEQKIAQARQIWNSIDNRFGEMVQDNIFWGKMSKQAAQLAMRSYSWNMGTIREIGGGGADLARGKWTPKAAYTLAMPIWVGTMNAAYQYLRTGKHPESVQDLLAGQTGGEQPGASVPSAKPFGRSTRATVPERVMIPGYQKDVFGWYEDWAQEAKNKVATGPRMVYDVLMNRDWKNDPIINPEDSAPTWLKQYFQYATNTLGPISIKEMLKGPKEGSKIGSVERGMGLRPAPPYLSDPEGHELGRSRRAGGAWRKKEILEKRQKSQYGGTDE